MEERIIDVVTAYESGGRDSLVITIPKKLRDEGKVKEGQKFLAKFDDDRGRLIYEPLER